MKIQLRPVLLLASLLFMPFLGVAQQSATTPQWSIVIHGGAGVIERKALTPEADKNYRASLAAALKAGSDVLDRGGSALDAVEATIHVLEDDPLFNAGRGAVFTRDGKNEMDSSIMDGVSLKAGAVAGVTRTRHPISLARAVMEKSPYVMMVGPGADAFSIKAGLEQAEPSFFFTESRWQSLIKQLKEEGLPLPNRPAGVPASAPVVPVAQLIRDFQIEESPDSHIHGTVGCVARDKNGNIAAGTSTGGLQGKMSGRVGDSPVIGAGTYANNQSCAVSATGSGEYFIRLGVAREICNLVRFKGMPLQQAADEVIHTELEAIHGDGGVIAITPDGTTAWSMNTPGMFRARLTQGSTPEVHIYSDEK
jgi:beta-aspartyl-peptidase (threonine type)